MQFEKDMKSVHKDLFLMIRRLILSFEGIEESKKTRITTYANQYGGICHLRTMPYGVDIGFLKGSRIQDDKGLLVGKGKAIKVLKLECYQEELIRSYLEKAISLNVK